MHSSLLLRTLILTLGLIIDGTDAASIVAYSNPNTCMGPLFSCSNIGANVCCGPFPTQFGFALQATGLSSLAELDLFSDGSCNLLYSSNFGSGNICVPLGGISVKSAKWRIPSRSRPRDAIGLNDGASTLQVPDIFSYTDENGEEREVELPVASVEAMEEIAQLWLNGDLASLTYEENALL